MTTSIHSCDDHYSWLALALRKCAFKVLLIYYITYENFDRMETGN